MTRSVRGFLALLIMVLALAVTGPVPIQAQDGATREQVDQLLERLRNGAPLEQERAAQDLAALGSPLAVPQLQVIFLSSDNPRLAAVALAGIGTPSALNVLVRALAAEELTPRRNAAQVALLQKGVDAVPALVSGLRGTPAVMRRHSAQLLGFIGSTRPVNALVRVARGDEDATVRAEAVWALGNIGSRRVQGTLKAIARSDPDLEVRLEAERAVLRLGQPF